jgi:hypothetical protein
MRHYRERSPNEPPMCLAGTYGQFKEEWLKVWTNRSADSTALLSLGKPFIENWEKQLLMKSASPDFHYQTLHMRLEGSGYDPHILIQRWVASISSVSSVKEELELLFLKLARTNGWFPKAASPQNTAYLFAHMFKGYLQREITNSLDPLVDAFYMVNIEECVPIEDTHPDYLHIQALCLDQWDSYLLLMIRQGYDRTSMSELTHIPEHIVRLERKVIWNRISTT